MNCITSKNYLYIKVRYYASDYHLRDGWQERTTSRKSHHQAAVDYNSFYDKFVEEFSGETTQELRNKYFTYYKEATEELLHEQTGVRICCAEGYYIYCIPKTPLGFDIYDWIITNCKCKHKVISKTKGTYMDRDATDYYRELGLKSAKRLSEIMKNSDL